MIYLNHFTLERKALLLVGPFIRFFRISRVRQFRHNSTSCLRTIFPRRWSHRPVFIIPPNAGRPPKYLPSLRAPWPSYSLVLPGSWEWRGMKLQQWRETKQTLELSSGLSRRWSRNTNRTIWESYRIHRENLLKKTFFGFLESKDSGIHFVGSLQTIRAHIIH